MFFEAVVFFGILICSFLILTFASKPDRHEQAVEDRLREIGLRAPGEPVQGERTEALLTEAGNVGFSPLDRLLSQLNLFPTLPTLIEEADSKSTPANVVLSTAGFGIGAFTLTWTCTRFAPLALASCLLCAVLPLASLRIRRARRIKAFNAALPDALDLMSRALRAGHAVSSAIEVLAEEAQEPVASEFSRVYQQQNFGLPFRDALLQMVRRVPSNDLRFAVTAMLVQKETGGNLTEILDRTTHVIRERLRILGEVRIKTAQGRLTGWILSLLPIVVGAIINVVNPGYARPLFTEPMGRMMLYAAGGMLVVGGFVIRKIVTIEV